MGPDNIPYKVSYRAVKYPRLEFKTGELLVILPFEHKPDVILDKYRSWIFDKLEFINECLEQAERKRLLTRSEEEFRNLIHFFVDEASEYLSVKLNRVYFRRMKTKWASLSSAKNLTVNRLMKYLPDNLIKYVIFHEVAHFIERRHNEKFWEIISSRYENHQEMEREMFVYWFKIFRLRMPQND